MITHKHSCYLSDVFSGGYESIKRVMSSVGDLLAEAEQDGRLPDYTHVAVRGVSGMCLGGAVAVQQEKGLIITRKTVCDSHAECLVEGCPTNIPFKYIVFDDFICSGKTVIKMIDKIQCVNPYAEFVGAMLYSNYGNPGFQTIVNLRSMSCELVNYLK